MSVRCDGEVPGDPKGPSVSKTTYDPRYLPTELAGVTIAKADILETRWEREAFDVAHARYVLLHLSRPELAVRNMLGALRPGGWMLLEEPDFLAAPPVSGRAEDCRAVERVNAAIVEMYTRRGVDPSLASRLPLLARSCAPEARLERVEMEGHLCPGGSTVAGVMRMSAERLAERYLETGKATEDDLRRFRRFTQNPEAWAIYYATIAVTLQAPSESTPKTENLSEVHVCVSNLWLL